MWDPYEFKNKSSKKLKEVEKLKSVQHSQLTGEGGQGNPISVMSKEELFLSIDYSNEPF